jgi:hypothetical protein
MIPRAAPAVRPPTGAASGIVYLAVHRLPPGDIRTRYEREFTAELYGMTAGRQLRLALGILATSGALRHAVHDHTPTTLETAMTLTRPAKPWACRLNLHHHWETRTTEDGARYQACTRCDKERSPVKNASNYPPLGG